MKLKKDKQSLRPIGLEVKHAAKLANLPLNEDEEEKYSEQLSAVLEYIDKLNKVDVSGVEPTYNVSGSSNIFRKDEVEECLLQEDVLAGGANTKGGFFVTKGVFESE